MGDHSANDRLPPSRRTSPVGVALGGLAVLGFAIPVATYFWLIQHYGVNDVYLDQWGDVAILRHSYSGSLTLSTLWAQHLEQRIFFPNLIVLSLGYATHLNIVVEEYLSATLLCLSALLLVLSHKRHSAKGWLWYCPVPILMLSSVQSYSTLFGFQLAWYLVILMLAASLFLLDRGSRSNWVLAGAIVAAVVGSFSSLPGLFIWPAGLVLLAQRRCRFAQAIAWCGAAVVAVFVYTYHYNGGEGFPDYRPGFDIPVPAVETFFRVIGSVFGLQLVNSNRYLSASEILVGFLLVLLACYALVTRGLLRDESSGAPLGVALICFGLVYSAVFAYGRAWAGAVQATESQYTTFTLLIVTGTYLALLDPPVRQVSGVISDKRVGRIVASLLAGAICLQVILGTFNGLRVASSFHRTQVEAAVVLVDVRNVPDSIMQASLGSSLLPAKLIRSYARTLALHHLSVFDSGDVAADRRQAALQQKAGAFDSPSPPATIVLNAHAVRTVKGRVTIDFLPTGDPEPTSVEFFLGSGLRNVALGLAAPSLAGWQRVWNSTGVPNGTYQMHATIHDARGITTSAPVTVVVDNPRHTAP
jgi:hypothetical protein